MLGESRGVELGLHTLQTISAWDALVADAAAVLEDAQLAPQFAERVMKLAAPGALTRSLSRGSSGGRPAGGCAELFEGGLDVVGAAVLVSAEPSGLADLIDRMFGAWRAGYRARRFERAVEDARNGRSSPDLVDYAPATSGGALEGPLDACEAAVLDALAPWKGSPDAPFASAPGLPPGPVVFATGITGLSPTGGSAGTEIKITGDFAELLPRLDAGDVVIGFPIADGASAQLAPKDHAPDGSWITVTVPEDARAGCVGFIDLSMLAAFNAWVERANDALASAGDALKQRLGISGAGGLGAFQPLTEPNPPCNGVNYFIGAGTEIDELTVDGSADIHVDTGSATSVTIRWAVRNASSIQISGRGFAGEEAVASAGSRVVDLPQALSQEVVTWTLAAGSPGGGTISKSVTATLLAVPSFTITALEPVYTSDEGELVRHHPAVFRLYVEDGIGQMGGAGVVAGLEIAIRTGSGFSTVLGPGTITTRHPGEVIPANQVGHLFSLPMAAVNDWTCVEVDVRVTWSSPSGATKASASRRWAGSVSRRSVDETIYVYTTTFQGQNPTSMLLTRQILGWLEQMLPVRRLYLVERGNIEIASWTAAQHTYFNDGDGNWLAYVLGQKADWWGAAVAASVSHAIPAGTEAIGGAWADLASGRGFWFKDATTPEQTAYHEYGHTLQLPHPRVPSSSSGTATGVDRWQPCPPAGQIGDPVAAPAGWLAGNSVMNAPPDLTNGGAGRLDLTASLPLAEAVAGTVGDIMTYFPSIAPSRAVFGRIFRALLGLQDPPLIPGEQYAHCRLGPRSREPGGAWLKVVGKRSKVLATFSASRPDAQFGAEELAWVVLDTNGDTFTSGTGVDPRCYPSKSTDVWILTVPWDPLASKVLRITRPGGETFDVEPAPSSELPIDARPSENHVVVSWPADPAGEGFARIECSERADGPWRDLTGILRESDVRTPGAGPCRIEADMKGLPVSASLRIRVTSSVQAARRVGETTIDWIVPPPEIVWTPPPPDEVAASSIRLAVSAFAPGDGHCLEDEAIQWFIEKPPGGDGSAVLEQVATGSVAFVHAAPGNLHVLVRCQDSAGRVSEARHTLSIQAAT
ncbi:MAG TPA: hypothetical protein VF516_12080 [Kofleriaceae bacterium]